MPNATVRGIAQMTDFGTGDIARGISVKCAVGDWGETG
jgi:hypothetical protein